MVGTSLLSEMGLEIVLETICKALQLKVEPLWRLGDPFPSQLVWIRRAKEPLNPSVTTELFCDPT